MSRSVDVLAVMECAAETLVRMKSAEANARLVNVQRDALNTARAAVAELIEAASEMNRLAKGPTGGVSQSEKRALVNRMDAALARVGGDA